MQMLQSAEVLAVGSELLTPHRVDTNSLYLAGRLDEIGIKLRTKSVVGDDPADLVALVRQALARADVIILTGGLGPTADDLTRDVVAEVLGLPLLEDAPILESLRQRFARRGMTMPEINRKQAQVPQGATVLPNSNGTAPGLWIEHGDRVVVLLPGPPRELQPIFEQQVRPRLVERTGGAVLRRRVLKMTGRAESQVESVAQPKYGPMAAWPTPVETTILAAPGQIELHLSARGDSQAEIDRVLNRAVSELADALGDIVFSSDGRSLPEVVGGLLKHHGEHISVAESCTGGLVLARLTDIAGSSDWVNGGVVAYANAVKVQQLDVPEAMLAEYGAVSEPVATAMATGVRARLRTEVGVGVTGIAGPSGGTEAKPVGTVAIAVDRTPGDGGEPRHAVRTFKFLGDREMVRAQAIQAALDMVRRAYQ
jgi:nicotinamide-nucleotide amidase